MNQSDAKKFVESFVEPSIEHHGIKNQRWGVTHGPPYPLDRGVSAAIKRKFRKKTPEERAEVREVKKAKREEKKQERKKKERQKILEDPSKLYKNRKKFTKQEIDDAMKTFEWEKKLKNYSNDKLEAGNKMFSSYVNKVQHGISAWNNIARIFNSFADRNENGDFRMPFIMNLPSNKELEEKKKNKKKSGDDSDKQDKPQDDKKKKNPEDNN